MYVGIRRRWIILLFFFSVTCITYFHIDECQDRNENEYEEAHCRCISKVRNAAGAERVIVNIVRHGDRRVRRSAVRQVDRLVEQLQRTVDGHDECHDDRRFEQWHGDPPECLPSVCAVDLGRLIYRILDVLQSGQIEYHVVSCPSPDQGEDDDGFRTCGISQEVVVLLKDPEVYKNRVDQSVRCEQGLEDQRIGYKGCRTGQEHTCTEESLESQVLVVQKLSQQDRKDQHDRHLDDQVKECISDRGHEHLVGKHSRVVVENRIIPLHVGTGSGLQ